jgi:hypothetical protein
LDEAFWAPEWRRSGDIVAEPDGGYLLTQATSPSGSVLAELTRDGSLHDEPLPKGYLMLGPTSDRDVFLLGRRVDDTGVSSHEVAMTALYLWHRGGGRQKHIADGTVAIAIGDGHPAIAYYQRAGGQWVAVSGTGETTELGRPARSSAISPDGRAIFVAGGDAVACGEVPPVDCSAGLVDIGTGKTVRHGPGPALGDPVWIGRSVAYVVLDGTSGRPEVAILSADAVRTVGLPPIAPPAVQSLDPTPPPGG